jgi:hypothetical protein
MPWLNRADARGVGNQANQASPSSSKTVTGPTRRRTERFMVNGHPPNVSGGGQPGRAARTRPAPRVTVPGLRGCTAGAPPDSIETATDAENVPSRATWTNLGSDTEPIVRVTGRRREEALAARDAVARRRCRAIGECLRRRRIWTRRAETPRVQITIAGRSPVACVFPVQHTAQWRLDNCFRDQAVTNAAQLAGLVSSADVPVMPPGA